jgi:hypothetical protein
MSIEERLVAARAEGWDEGMRHAHRQAFNAVIGRHVVITETPEAIVHHTADAIGERITVARLTENPHRREETRRDRLRG